VIHTSGEDAIFHFFSIVTEDSEGRQKTTRLSHSTYLEIVAASNFKQRSRKMLEYFHGDRLHYAVCGTPNRLEYDQGFFVKNGDGAADFKPIAHLYKSQVYQLAKLLDIPDSIRTRPPTTDTYSLPQSQEEFYFSLPYDQMDLCLYGVDHNIAAEEVAAALNIPTNTVRRVYLDIATKRRTTEYLHLAPLLIKDQKRI
jgi:NAD+ synthase